MSAIRWAAALLWRSRRTGGVLAASLFPPPLVLWIGFALPHGLIAGPIQIALLAAGWRALR